MNNSEWSGRYSSQLNLPEIGVDGQRRLAESSVLIVGCGALGSVAAMYLAGAGVGNLILFDFDTIDESNLHRQPFFSSDETGMYKADILQKKIQALNPSVNVVIRKEMFCRRILSSLPDRIDFVIDGADNPGTTYMIESFCKERNIAFSTAGVGGWSGQILTCVPGSICFEDLFPRPVGNSGVLPCSIGGIAGPLPGIMACLQASETIKYIVNGGRLLTNRLLSIDLLNGKFTEMEL